MDLQNREKKLKGLNVCLEKCCWGQTCMKNHGSEWCLTAFVTFVTNVPLLSNSSIVYITMELYNDSLSCESPFFVRSYKKHFSFFIEFK